MHISKRHNNTRERKRERERGGRERERKKEREREERETSWRILFLLMTDSDDPKVCQVTDSVDARPFPPGDQGSKALLFKHSPFAHVRR